MSRAPAIVAALFLVLLAWVWGLPPGFLNTGLAQGGVALLSHTVDGGGTTQSVGSGYSLGATAGQADAGHLASGDFALSGGFWTSSVGAPSGTPGLVVNTTSDADDGSCDATHCSLREAIDAANANAGPDTIGFNIPGSDDGCDAGGVCAIQPASLLPFLTDDGTTIDGFTQPGASAGDNPVLKIVLDGYDNGQFSGMGIQSASNTIRGLVIQRFTPFTAIAIFGVNASNNHIQENFIGTDAGGTEPRGNCTPPTSCAAITIDSGAHDNVVGPDNLIAFNGLGPQISDQGTRGNTITRNSIHSNAQQGISLASGGNDELAAPAVALAQATQVTGTACPGCVVELFSDAEDEGAVYEGMTTANNVGAWTFMKPGGLAGPNVTATATDGDGNTSEFSAPVHVSESGGWLLYVPLIAND